MLEFEDFSGFENRVNRLEDQVSDLREDSGSTKASLSTIIEKIGDLKEDLNEKVSDLKTELNERLDTQDEALGKVNLSLEKHEKTLEEIQVSKKKTADRIEAWKKWLALLVTAGVGAIAKELMIWLLK